MSSQINQSIFNNYNNYNNNNNNKEKMKSATGDGAFNAWDEEFHDAQQQRGVERDVILEDLTQRLRIMEDHIINTINNDNRSSSSSPATITAITIVKQEIEKRKGWLKDVLIARTNSAIAALSEKDNNGNNNNMSSSSISSNIDLTSKLDTNRGILKMQQETLKQQDDALDEISRGFAVLKSIGTSIGTEVDLHNKLLDDMNDDVEIGNQDLVRETEHTTQVAKQARTTHLWCTIMLLVILLIVLIAAKS
jgi:SYP5 family syntaxin